MYPMQEKLQMKNVSAMVSALMSFDMRLTVLLIISARTKKKRIWQ
jgi:hypothetical protein